MLREEVTVTTQSGSAADAAEALVQAGLFTSYEDFAAVCELNGYDPTDIKANTFTFAPGTTQSQIAEEVMKVLEEGVANKLGSSNAGVKGYKVAAKTGTSEKRDKKDKEGGYSLRVASCISIAPADDAAVSMIVIVDEPTLSREEGSMIAAPYNSKIMAEVLPYLGSLPEYSEDDEHFRSVTVGTYVGQDTDSAKAAVRKLGLTAEIVGEGGTVRAQMPAAGTEMTVRGGKVLLYVTDDVSEKTVTVPDLVGKNVEECRELISGRGLNADLTGTVSLGASCYAVKQYPEAGANVKEGTVITVEFRISESDDHSLLSD